MIEVHHFIGHPFGTYLFIFSYGRLYLHNIKRMLRIQWTYKQQQLQSHTHIHTFTHNIQNIVETTGDKPE